MNPVQQVCSGKQSICPIVVRGLVFLIYSTCRVTVLLQIGMLSDKLGAWMVFEQDILPSSYRGGAVDSLCPISGVSSSDFIDWGF